MTTKHTEPDELRRDRERDEKKPTEQPVRRPRPLVDEPETSDFRIPRF